MIYLTIWNFYPDDLQPDYDLPKIKGYIREQFLIEDSFWTAFETNVIANQKNHGIEISSLIKVCRNPLPKNPLYYPVAVLQDFFINPLPSSTPNRNIDLQNLLNEINKLINHFQNILSINGVNITNQYLDWETFKRNANLDAINTTISEFLSLGKLQNDSDMQTLVVLYAFKYCIEYYSQEYHSKSLSQYNIILYEDK